MGRCLLLFALEIGRCRADLTFLRPFFVFRLFVPPEGDGWSIAAYAELETTAATPVSASVTFSLFEIGGGAAIATSVPASATVPAAGKGTFTATGRLRMVRHFPAQFPPF